MVPSTGDWERLAIGESVSLDCATLVKVTLVSAISYMSWVATMLLSVDGLEDDDVVASLNDWLRNDAPWNGPSVPPGATGVGFLAL